MHLPDTEQCSDVHDILRPMVRYPALMSHMALPALPSRGARQVLLELVLPKRSNGATMGRHCRGLSCSCLPTCLQQRASEV